MNHEQKSPVVLYVNDMIGVERDIINAISGQLEDDRFTAFPGLAAACRDMVEKGEERIGKLKEIADARGGEFGAKLKEGVMALTGTLAGIYGKLREHPVSRMVRDDVVALHVSFTAYGMLHTLAIATGDETVAEMAETALREIGATLPVIADFLPGIVVAEVSMDCEIVEPAAADLARATISRAARLA